MGIKRVVPDIVCDPLEESRDFYVDVFGFDVAMDMGWIVTLTSPDEPAAQISLFPATEECGDADPQHHGRGRRRRGCARGGRGVRSRDRVSVDRRGLGGASASSLSIRAAWSST